MRLDIKGLAYPEQYGEKPYPVTLKCRLEGEKLYIDEVTTDEIPEKSA